MRKTSDVNQPLVSINTQVCMHVHTHTYIHTYIHMDMTALADQGAFIWCTNHDRLCSETCRQRVRMELGEVT